jgi:hypothetical protein
MDTETTLWPRKLIDKCNEKEINKIKSSIASYAWNNAAATDGTAMAWHLSSVLSSLRSPMQSPKSSRELMAARPGRPPREPRARPSTQQGMTALSLLMASWPGRRPGNFLLRLRQQQLVLTFFFLLRHLLLLEPLADTATSGSICQCSS